MDKEFLKSFLRFLDDASDKEVYDKLDKVYSLMALTKSPEARRDARMLIRLLENELLARTECRKVAAAK